MSARCVAVACLHRTVACARAVAAAQYAFERDEQKQKSKKLRDELANVVGGGKKVAEKATKLEVKYEQLREKYDADLATLVQMRLELAKAKARLADFDRPQIV